MSANRDLVRSICASWERGDFSGSSDCVPPEIEYVIADGPSSGHWTGIAGLRKGFRDFLSTWEDLRAEVGEYRELDDERVPVFHDFSGRARTSGLELEEMRPRTADLFHVRGNKVTRLIAYRDGEHALADLGLAADGDAAGPTS